MKKFSFYITAVMLLCGLTLASCIDDKEPDGIKDMREAKAEYYRAEAAYKLAEAALKQAEADLQQQMVEAQKLLNQLTAAQNEAEITRLQAELAVLLRKIEVEKLEADLAYDNALKDLELAIAKNNEEYTAQLKDIKDRITTNREAYRDILTQITAAKLDLVDLNGKFDADSWAAKLQLVIDKKELEVNYLAQQKLLYESVDKIAYDKINTKMVELNKEIRELIVEYNEGVQQTQQLQADKSKAESDRDELKEQLKNAREITWNTEESVDITVPIYIQDEFVNLAAFKPEATTTTPIDLTDRMDISTKKSVSYNNAINGGGNLETYSLKGNKYTVERRSLNPKADDLADATVTLMRDELADYQDVAGLLGTAADNAYTIALANEGITGGNSDENLKKAFANIQVRTTYMNSHKAIYDRDKANWQTALNNYNTAKTNYMSPVTETEDYYAYAAEIWRHYDVDLAANPALQTTAEKNHVITALKNYARYREAMDGWAQYNATFSRRLAEDLVLDDFDPALGYNIGTLAGQILGSATLNATGPFSNDGGVTTLNHEDFPYGALIITSRIAFGKPVLNDINDAITVAPEDANELYRPTPGLGGSYMVYFAEYEKLNDLQKANAWNTVMTQVNTYYASYDAKYDVLSAQQDADDKELNPLQDIVNDIAIALSLQEAEYGLASVIEPSIVKYDDATNTISLSFAPQGTLGGYINDMVNVHNALAQETTNFEEQLYGNGLNDPSNTGIIYRLAHAQEELAEAIHEMAFFEADGRKDSGEYIKVTIEKKEAEIANLESDADAYKAEFDALSKELEAFLAVINARF